MKNIVDILNNIEETPSSRCWESIEQQLGAISPSSQQPSGDGGMTTQSASSGVKGAFLQKSTAFLGKVAAISVSAVTVVTVATVLIINALTDNPETVHNGEIAPLPEIYAVEDSLPEILESPLALLNNNQTKNHLEETEIPASPPIVSLFDTTSSSFKNHTTSYANRQSHSSIPSPPFEEEKKSNPIEKEEKANHIVTPLSKSEKPTEVTTNTRKDTSDHSQELIVTPSPEIIDIEIPNVITPNGDGINDVFVISGIESCEKARLVIVSRNNKVVFQANHYENNWTADNVEDGVYYYFFHYTINGVEGKRSGSLTIIRKI